MWPFGNKKTGEETDAAVTADKDAGLLAVTDVTTVKTKKSTASEKKRKLSIFPQDVPGDKPLLKPEAEHKRHLRLARRIRIQAILIVVLFAALFLAYPLFKTSYVYQARQIGAPIGSEKRLAELDVPVLTRDAVISWAMTTVTEVMTFNFSNYDSRILMFADRFKPEGWENFVKALAEAGTIEQFRAQQLVSTAAPTAPATIEYEGINPSTGEYEWKVKVSVIRKFITNNERSDIKKQTVYLTLVRVPVLEHPGGIGIKVWVER